MLGGMRFWNMQLITTFMEVKKMSIKEKLVAKQEELKALMPQVNEGNEEAIKSSEGLVEEIKGLEDLIKKADEATAIMQNIGQVKEEKTDEAKAANLEELKTVKGSRSFAYKAYNDVQTKPTVNVVDNKVVDPQGTLNVRSLFGSESINGNSLTYYVLGAMEGTIGTTAEGAKKNQIHFGYTPTTVALAKITAFIKETDELLSDAAFLESAIRNRGLYEFKKAVENYLVTTLAGTSGVQVGQSSISFDNLLKAKQAVRTATGYAADAILINPADLEALLLTKDSNLQYLLGGPAYGSYGNGAYAANPRIWGLPVVESDAVAEGQAIVGAFKAGSSVVAKAGEGLRVEVSNSDGDDFTYNRVTVRMEERLLLATRVPSAFVKVGTAASSS